LRLEQAESHLLAHVAACGIKSLVVVLPLPPSAGGSPPAFWLFAPIQRTSSRRHHQDARHQGDPCGNAANADVSLPARASLTPTARPTSTLSRASPRGALVGRSLTSHRQAWLSSGHRMRTPTDTVGVRMSSAHLELRACPKFAVAGPFSGFRLVSPFGCHLSTCGSAKS
jgi:hypothetical protein